MKNLLSLSLPITLTAVGSIATGCGDSHQYVFRNDIRPTYEKTVNVRELRQMQDTSDLVLIDVRLLEDYQANETLIPGASYRNPEKIQTWASALPEDSKVVVYCVAGRWVSQKAASYLSDQGIENYTLTGGIEAWQQNE